MSAADVGRRRHNASPVQVSMLLTVRDRELAELVGRFGAVEAEQVMAWFGLGPRQWPTGSCAGTSARCAPGFRDRCSVPRGDGDLRSEP